MKNSLFILAGAAALSLASCSQEKTTEVNTAPADGAATTTTTTTTTMTPMTDAQMEARAQRIADKMVADMKITDEATKTKIRTVYVNRYKRMNELRTKYTTDTTGMAGAMRDSRTAEDQEFKTVFTDPTQYQAYESSRSTYNDSNYTDDTPSATSMSDTTGSMSSSSMSTDNTMSSSSSSTMTTPSGANVSKMKAKGEDGSKIKMKENGKVKTKDADGDKMKN